MDADTCPACGCDLEAQPPRHERGFLYGLECRACPPEARRRIVLPRAERVPFVDCPACGDRKEPADLHPDVVVVKELIHEVCAACGERCGVFAARRLVDRADMSM